MSCSHNRIIGDNYGSSCYDCGQQMSGMGNFGEHSKVCFHDWVKYGGNEICSFCQAERKHFGNDEG